MKCMFRFYNYLIYSQTRHEHKLEAYQYVVSMI